jgi:hypothetical protein
MSLDKVPEKLLCSLPPEKQEVLRYRFENSCWAGHYGTTLVSIAGLAALCFIAFCVLHRISEPPASDIFYTAATMSAITAIVMMMIIGSADKIMKMQFRRKYLA